MFWIPLRYLSDAGFGALWSSALVLGAGLPISLLMAFWLGKWRREDAGWVALVGIGIGLSMVFYFYAVVSTDVVRAIFLFYMLPIWATLIDRVVFGNRLNIGRSFAVLLAFFGLWLLLGGDGGIPLPRNAGDWSGLAAGFLWGGTLALVSGRANVDAHWNVASAVLFGAVFSALAAAISGSIAITQGSMSVSLAAGVFAFAILVFWPSMIGQLWGARLVPATRAALLTMSELVVAIISAWLLIGSSLSSLSAIGGLVIVTAVIVDIFSNRQPGLPSTQ